MRQIMALIALLGLATMAAAQDKPYVEGDVDGFLAGAKAKGRPAAVLFNFNLETG